MLHKFIKDDESEWPWREQSKLYDYIACTSVTLQNACVTSNRINDIIYEIIINYINTILWNDDGDGVVKYKCINCNKLYFYSICDECYESESEKPNDDFDP